MLKPLQSGWLQSGLLLCVLTLSSGASTLLLLGARGQQTPAPAAAPIPPEAASKVSPVKPTAESLAHAKKVYGYDCAMCHGPTGNGKTDLATQMTLTLKDWTSPAALKDMTDGELYYIIAKGRGTMTGEEGRVSPEVMWNMVALVRGFGKS